jgi:Rrf2 family protein
MLSKKAKYAIRAMLHLARRRATGPILVKEIAAQERIPQKFLEGILGELTGAGFLLSKTGKGGGYSLRLPPAQITLGRLMRQIDGPLAPIPCVSQMAYAPCADCPDEKICLVRMVMKQVRDATAQILDKLTLEQMLQQEEQLSKAAGVLDFHI